MPEHQFVDFNQKLNPPMKLVGIFLKYPTLIGVWRECLKDRAFQEVQNLAMSAIDRKDFNSLDKYTMMIVKFLKASKSTRAKGFLYWRLNQNK